MSNEIKRLRAVLEGIELPATRRPMIDRYFGYTGWVDRKATNARQAHYVLRMTALVGGILLPAIAGLDVGSDTLALQWATVALGAIVGVSIALDGFLNLGERWLHYRRASEGMQAELWQFATLSGERYAGMASHEQAFPALVAACERALAAELDTYVNGPAREAPTTEAAGAA